VEVDDCLGDDAIAQLIDGQLGQAERAAVHAHIDRCEACRALVADAVRDGDAADAPLAPGSVLGRYVVVDVLGAGAMGVVYGAWDPQLERRIALKLLRPDREPGDASRLLREAQAMARLQHPNVVAVHDVGTIGERVFVAMELVDGDTLAGWLHAGRRSWRAIVDVFEQVGEGLVAAHRAGLVHRDFKPDNVLVGRDGRARVGDFGLAHAAHRAGTGLAAGPIGALTRTGALVGTPAYMAPEQFGGGIADARSDQFAFCLALYEALYGERPFAGEDLEALHRAMVAGEVRRPPAASQVPARVRRIVLRGLATDPARRHRDMRAVLDDLARAERVRGTRVAVAAIVGMTAFAIAGMTMRRHGPAPCSGADEVWGDTWSDGERAAVRTAFEHTGRPGAAFAFDRIDRALASFRTSWVATERRVCEATRVHHVQSDALLAARMQCLDDRRRDAVAVAGVLASADAGVVDDFATLLDGLGSVDACASVRASGAQEPQGSAVAALRDRLAEAKALDEAGRYDRGLAIARAAAGEAHRLGANTLEAELLYRRAHLERMANAGDAVATLHAAAETALAAQDDGTAADAWTYLSYLVGFDAGQRGEGERWSSYAAAAIRRLGGDDLREASRLHYLFGIIYTDEQRGDEAAALLARARELIDRAGAPDRMVIRHLQDRGAFALQRGKLDEAYAAYRSERERAERVAGPDNPGLSTDLDNEAIALVMLGRPAEAVPIYRHALALLASVQRSGNGEAFTRFSLARALRSLGKPAAALDEDRRAVAIYDQVQPPVTWIGEALTGEGEDLLALARAHEAIAPLERALVLRSRPGADPEDRANTAFALARALWDGGADRARALDLARDARAVIAPFAERYGAYHAEALIRIDGWLATRSRGRGTGSAG
jgi:hypothetical protein